MKKAVIYTCVGVVAAGEIELVSSDLAGSNNRVLDNIKGRWSQTLKFLGNEANINAEYDRNARENFLSEATISGKVDDVSYELKTGFGDTHELTLNANTKDGTALEVVADNNNGITQLTASRGVKVQGRDVDVEASHSPKASQSKLKLSSVFGHGVSGSATWDVGSKLDSTDYEIEYASSVGDGRSVSATVNPKDGSGDIEYVDSKTIDATITASMDLGGKPKLSVKRAWNF
jgi:hypothetical protein